MIRKLVRVIALLSVVSGLTILFYIVSPIVSWYLFFAPSLEQQLISPIPDLIHDATDQVTKPAIDSTDAKEWFSKTDNLLTKTIPKITSYTLSIPKLRIKNATVSTVSYDMSKQLIHYPGTPLAPQNGSGIIFGHSSLPQFYGTDNYESIFTYLYTLKKGDDVLLAYPDITYRYSVESATIVKPTDTSVFVQNTSGSFITLVTCVPPGTTWRRLLVKAKLQTL